MFSKQDFAKILLLTLCERLHFRFWQKNAKMPVFPKFVASVHFEAEALPEQPIMIGNRDGQWLLHIDRPYAS